MRVCVFGAGAIGGHLAARLGSQPAVQLCVVARGAQLAAIRSQGIRLVSKDGDAHAQNVIATDDPDTLPEQDIVFVTLKSVSQSSQAEQLRRLIGSTGHAVFISNGIPWWWSHGTSAPGPLGLVDEGASLWRMFGAHNAMGCVVYSGNEVVEPGLIRHAGNNRWLLGEPDNSSSARLMRTVRLMNAAGLGAEVCNDIRREVFAKLLINAIYNSISALTRLPVEWYDVDDSLAEMMRSVADELVEVAAALNLDVSPERASVLRPRMREPGLTFGDGQKPSMLQDVLANRPLEVESILGQVHAFAQQLSVPCPHLKTLLALLRGLNIQIQLKPKG